LKSRRDKIPSCLKIDSMPVAEPKISPKTKTRKASVARRPDGEVNQAPVAWGRRLARLVGEKFGVQMISDRAKNEGTRSKTRIVIKCAKSPFPPIFVTLEMLERTDEVWGVFLHEEGGEVWSCPASYVRRVAYVTRNPKIAPRASIGLKKMRRGGQLIGIISQDEVESCHIP
jgi:hypothetical protein